MPRFVATDDDVTLLKDFLDQRPDLRHLRIKRRGASITLLSGSDGDPVRHIRLTRMSKSFWRLDMATHSGRWEQTPFAGSLPGVVQELAANFGWILESFDNPVPTSDPPY